MGVLSGLKPEKVFYYFEELCKIPHGSYHTKQISDYLSNLFRCRCGCQKAVRYMEVLLRNQDLC